MVARTLVCSVVFRRRLVVFSSHRTSAEADAAS
jgi:hypothetical protein